MDKLSMVERVYEINVLVDACSKEHFYDVSIVSARGSFSFRKCSRIVPNYSSDVMIAITFYRNEFHPIGSCRLIADEIEDIYLEENILFIIMK